MPKEATLFAEPPKYSAILAEDSILQMVQTGRLIVDSTFDASSLQTTSYDIRVGKKAIIGGQGKEMDLTSESLVIDPGSYAGIISLEKIKLPNNVLAQIGSKRKFSYEGLILLTGSVIDPGYEGHLLFGLYNASTKRVVIPTRTKICNIVFVLLEKEQKPVAPDPALLIGSFPSDFVNKMANMEVLPWARISEEVKQIQRLTQDVLNLKSQYNDVLEPIKTLTKNVDKVSADVALLAHELKGLATQANKLESITTENTKQIHEIITGIRLLPGEVGNLKTTTSRQETEITSMATKFGRFSLATYAFWGILLLLLGAGVKTLLDRALSSGGSAPKIGISAPANRP